MASYFTIRGIKRKLQIEEAESEQDTYLSELGKEADNYIDKQISLHATTPIANPDDELKGLADKHAAAEYILWNSPNHSRTLYDAARKDIQDHIMAAYGKKNPSGLGSTLSFAKTDSNTTGLE